MAENAKTPPPRKDEDTGRPLGTPYGPHPHGVDEAAGGADSSPLDTEPTGDRAKTAADAKPGDGGEQVNSTR